MSNVLFNLNDINFANKQTFAGFNDYSFLDASYPKNNNLSDLTDINFLDSISSNLKKLMVGLVILTQSKVMLVYVIFRYGT
jgi:hypothetical protein